MKLIIFHLLLIINLNLLAQYKSNYRYKEIQPKSDTIQLDTLSIIPGSVIVKTERGVLLDSTSYQVICPSSKIVFFDKKLENLFLLPILHF